MARTTSIPRDIQVRYRSVDRCNKRRTFKTLEGAQKFAQKFVGPHPEISEAFRYAVSADGVGKITVTGATLQELFPAVREDQAPEFDEEPFPSAGSLFERDGYDRDDYGY